MTVIRLASLLWRRGGSRQRATLALTAAGVLASTVLALLVVSVLPALGHREDRAAWRTPMQVRDVAGASALQRTTSDSYRDQNIDRIDLAPAASGAATNLPAPPGLDRFPAAGEVFASPALARLLRSEPAGQLADRYPGVLAGTIGPAGLAHADELVVVVGRTHAALAALPQAGAAGASSGGFPEGATPELVTADLVTPVDGFATRAAEVAGSAQGFVRGYAGTYRALAQIAAVLLVVPTVLLIGAAARLTAAQRAQRLAALRLAGASPFTVIALTALEIAAAAAVGALAGIVTYLAVLPVVARIPLAGGTFSVADLRLSPAILLIAAAAIPLVAVATAVVALRGVVGGPLETSRRVQPRRPRAVRLLAVPAAWVLFVMAASTMRGGGSVVGVLVGLGAVIVTLAVIGPWLTWLIGATLGGAARGPSTLIAARRITDDPKGAYRTVSGMVLAGLIAGFLFGVLPSVNAVDADVPPTGELYLVLPPGDVVAVTAAVEQRFPDANIDWGDGATDGNPSQASVSSDGTSEAAHGFGSIEVRDPADIEAARTAVLAVSPDAEVSSPFELGSDRILLADLGRASTIMSLAALLMATAAAGIGGAAAILDQRVTLARLRLVGTPIAVLQRARRWQTLVPLVLASAGAMAFGAAAGQLLLRAFRVSDQRIVAPDFGSMAVLGVAAVAAGLAVVAMTRPLLVSVSRSTPRD